MSIRPIIFGATGMVGEGVLHVSLNQPDVESVLVVGRNPCGVIHPKLREIIHRDFFDFSGIESELKGHNACFFCLGISSVGKTEEFYRHITYDLTMAAAKTLSRLNPDMTFCYVSGAGTAEKGRLMWARVKGKTENDLLKLPFKDAYMFRPGFIKPIRGSKRAYKVSVILGHVYPMLRALFPAYVCTLDDIALAMIRSADTGHSKKILENRDITHLAGSSDAAEN